MNLNKLNDYLYQSDYKTAKVLTETFKYKDYGIRGVICPAYNAGLNYAIGLSALILPIDDYDTIDTATFKLALDFYLLYKPVLVHCMGGKNRSVAFCAAIMGIEPTKVYKKLGYYPTKELQDSVMRWYEG